MTKKEFIIEMISDLIEKVEYDEIIGKEFLSDLNALSLVIEYGNENNVKEKMSEIITKADSMYCIEIGDTLFEIINLLNENDRFYYDMAR